MSKKVKAIIIAVGALILIGGIYFWGESQRTSYEDLDQQIEAELEAEAAIEALVDEMEAE